LTQDDQGAGRSREASEVTTHAMSARAKSRRPRERSELAVWSDGWPRAQRAGQTELHDAAIKIAAIKIA